jgi:two-component system, NarL family, response regulator LiaR
MTLMRQLLARQLARETDIHIVAEAANGQEAVEAVNRHAPRVVLMDLEMPLMNGVQATQQISRDFPATRVILLTSHGDLTSVGRMAGAADALPKTCTPVELTDAIRRVAGEEAAPLGFVGYAPLASASVADSVAGKVARVSEQYHLTDRERAVLEKLVDADLTRQQIANALARAWRQPVSDSAVKHTQERILAKVGVEPRTRAALLKFVLESRAETPALRRAA